jgi:gluconate kinase
VIERDLDILLVEIKRSITQSDKDRNKFLKRLKDNSILTQSNTKKQGFLPISALDGA